MRDTQKFTWEQLLAGDLVLGEQGVAVLVIDVHRDSVGMPGHVSGLDEVRCQMLDLSEDSLDPLYHLVRMGHNSIPDAVKIIREGEVIWRASEPERVV